MVDSYLEIKDKHLTLMVNIVSGAAVTQMAEVDGRDGSVLGDLLRQARPLLSIMYSNPANPCAHTPERSPTQRSLLPGYGGCAHTHTAFCPQGPEGVEMASGEGEKVKMQTKGR